MELRSIGLYLFIGTVILCTLATTNSYEQKGFEGNFCNASQPCALDPQGCELVQCDCPSRSNSRCQEVDTCGTSCTFTWLKSNSCCDFVPQEFHDNRTLHVLHIERYKDVDSQDESKIFLKIMVWSSHDDSPGLWKLLRINLINVSNSTGLAIPSTLAISNTMDFTGVETDQDMKDMIDSIIEVPPANSSLARGLASFWDQTGECRQDLNCVEDVKSLCDCYQCRTVSNAVEHLGVSNQYTNAADGWYIVGIGNDVATYIGVSSELSSLHSSDNTINEWKEGTFGGWAPAANDSQMYMAFHDATNICGIAIQGMAASTFRSLDLFTVSVGGKDLVDDNNLTITFKSGALLQTTSSHFFKDPVKSGCIQINVKEPKFPTRVGFRAGLIACDSQIPYCQNEEVCNLIDKVVADFEDVKESPELYDSSQSNTEVAAVALFGIIDDILTRETYPEEPFATTVQLDNFEVNLVGNKSENLKHDGFTFTSTKANGEDDVGDHSEPELSVSIPNGAFDEFPENVTVVIVVTIVKQNESYDKPGANVSVKDDDTQYNVGSALIQINTYVNNEIFSLTQFDFKTTYKNLSEYQEPHCAYFEEEDTDWNDTIFWKFDGCKIDDNATELVAKCSCTHTTSFSVLLSIGTPRPPTLWDEIGSVVTKVGLSISIVALVCALLIYFVLRSTISSARYAIHSNLMVSLLLVAVVFLSLLERTEPKLLCQFTTYLLQYLFLSSFCWMLAEGVHLYRQIITVFESEKKHTWVYFAIGWGLPLIFVVAALAFMMTTPVTEEKKICYLTNDEGHIWFVVIPILIIVVINLCILIRVTLVVVKAVKFQAEKESSEKVTQVKAGVRSALLLMPLLGSTHLLSILASNNGVMQILNDVLNSLQGLFVALFYCAMNSEVRNAISQYIRRSKDASTIQGSTTGLKETSKSGKSKGLFGKKNKVGATTQFTFTSGSQSRLGSSSTDDLAPIS
ncbi:uncharacterized protein [Apostichopus japonicus]|uniref:uncharacterized protein isoform X2 n=1 Tax=Stichopus japonicus TaxID=307972 RepID=UPI003AB6360D